MSFASNGDAFLGGIARRRSARLLWTGLASALLAAGTVHAGSSVAAHATAAPRVALAGLPLNFEANLGQAPAAVQFLARGSNYAIGLDARGATLSLADGGHDVIRLQLEGARAHGLPHAEQPLPGRVNYLIGRDSSQWHTDIATYAQVRYAGVYPGIDLLYYGNQGQLEYDFAIAPRARVDAIHLRFAGAEALRRDAAGNLHLRKSGRELVFERPVAYQMAGGHRRLVAANYRIEGRAIGFEVGDYDHDRALVIDPVLSYLSYLGGSATESVGNVTGYGAAGVTNFTSPVAVDSAGNLYVTGSTYSTNFPTVGGTGAAPAKFNGQSKTWVFVSKIAPNGASLVYSTYIGGTFDDYGNAIAVDSAGSAYVTGYTDSSDFPATAGAFQTICAPTRSGATGLEQQNCFQAANLSVNQWGNAFVAKLNPAGNALAYASFLGTANSVGEAIAVDASGRAYVVGNSYPNGCGANGNPAYFCFPTTAGALLPDAAGFSTSAFVSVFNASGTSLLYSSLYGDRNRGSTANGYRDAVGTAVAVDAAGNFYVAGQTSDGQLPTTAGALQPVPAPSIDANGDVNAIRAFVAKFSPVGGASAPTQLYGTYLGGLTAGTADFVSGLAADALGNAYVYGWTSDNAFPVSGGAYQATCATGGNGLCANAAYIAKLNPTGSALLWATFFGDATGSGDGVNGTGGLALDAAGNTYITGIAGHLLPQVNPVQAASASNAQAFAAKFDASGSHLLFSTLLGGLAGSQEGSGIAVDGNGNIYVAGNTNAAGFTTTTGVFQSAYGGTSGTGFNQYSGDGFVAKISSLIASTNTALAAAPASAVSGTAVVLSATVTPASGNGTPTGTVTFKEGATVLGTGTLNGTGLAQFTTSTLTVGAHPITAAYGGDSGDLASTSAATTVTITAPLPPAAPTGLTATAGNAQVTLAWTASSGATSYSVYQGTSAGGEAATAVLTGITGTSTTITSLANGTGYYFTVAAVNANGTSTHSAEASATPAAPATGGGGGSSGSGGGGGALDAWALLALAAAVLLGIVQVARAQRAGRA